MTKKEQSYTKRYGVCAAAVFKSISKVMAAGRTGDPILIAKERARHAAFMANLPL